ncbi:MAG TPA: ABC transporter permease [Arenimonas sp.]|uniref:ABC transporter permease n=1 Tax=Arenimonas sp. TaxID=1872635 RepID=UPI002C234C14|nr:ABC transporter permease [Arenimonas sp.]HMB58006.1 ABC transporter permease [Arenimonas sp.]
MLKNYLLIAWKVYTRRKLFTAINLLCITITLMVLLVVTALLQNAFYPTGVEGKSDRFLQVTTLVSLNKDGSSSRTSPLGYKVIEQYLRPMKSAQLVAAVTGIKTVSVYQDDRVTELQLRRADAGYWKILDFKVLDGRVPSAEDVALGRFVAVLNETSARKLFPGSKAVGQKLNVGGQKFEIIGVVEDVMQLNSYADIWAPISTDPSTEYRDQMSGEFSALLLAKSPADIPRMQAEVAQIAPQIKFDDPKEWNQAFMWADTKLDFFARGLLDNERAPNSGAAVLLTAIAVLMLMFMLLPALNLVNLNTGRIMERSTEIGVRKAFGASSGTLVLQFVAENVILCLVGGLLGLILAKGVLIWLENSGLIPYLKVDINFSVFFCGLIITVVFGLLSGVIPAWKMSRLHPVQALKGAA